MTKYSGLNNILNIKDKEPSYYGYLGGQLAGGTVAAVPSIITSLPLHKYMYESAHGPPQSTPELTAAVAKAERFNDPFQALEYLHGPPSTQWQKGMHTARALSLGQMGPAVITGKKGKAVIWEGLDPTKRLPTAVLAHEAGHLQQYAPLLKALGATRGLSLLTSGYSLLTKDEDRARASALVAAGSMLPSVANEIDASRRGAKLIKSLSPALKLKVYMGVPTYIAAALAPLLGFKVMQQFGGYREKGLAHKLKDR